MSEIAHNHPPRCCCERYSYGTTQALRNCPLCTEHGELAQLAQPQPGECPLCHSEIGKQHTDYCRFTGTVEALPILNLDDFHTQTSNPISLGPLEGTDMTYTQTGAETCPDRDQHELMTYCGTCHTTFSAAGPSDFRTQTSTPRATHARTELDRASLDAMLTGNGYLLNGRRLPPEDVTIVHRDQTQGDRWHQDGPDSAHERTQCDPAVCGDTPPPEIHEVDVRHGQHYTRYGRHPITECSPINCGRDATREPTPLAEDTPTTQPATCGHPDYPDCPHHGQHP
jgi:hypothetical protein